MNENSEAAEVSSEGFAAKRDTCCFDNDEEKDGHGGSINWTRWTEAGERGGRGGRAVLKSVDPAKETGDAAGSYWS
jgi:hypothetical protein